MKINDLNIKINVLTLVSTKDDYGGVTTSTESTVSLFAKGIDLRGSFSYDKGQKNFNNTYKFIVRYNPAFTFNKTMVIEYKSERYAINEIVKKDIGKLETVELLCQHLQ